MVTLFAFLAPPPGRLRGNIYTDHLYWKARSVFPMSVTAEALRAKIDLKSVFWKGVPGGSVSYRPNFRIEGNVPYQSFLHG